MDVLDPITIARYWSKIDVKPSIKECWLWRGAKNGNGYGNFRAPGFGRRTMSAHRVAYALFNGAWPAEDLLIRHDCDTPLCQNPNHLRLGTKADNSRDMRERGRSFMCGRVMEGEANPSAKLNHEKVEQIRSLIERGKSNTMIAQRFGVTHATISNIRRGKSWTQPRIDGTEVNMPSDLRTGGR